MSENKDENAVKDKSGSVSIIRFIVTYVVLMGVFFLLLGLTPVKNIIDVNGAYSEAIVVITAKILGLFGISAAYEGTLIMLPSITLDVEFGCNGLEAVMIYCVAVLTFPATWKNRILGIVLGFLVIQVLNLIRIVALAYSAVYHKELFDLVHLYVAQGVMIAVALGTVVLYLTYISNGDSKPKEAAAV